MSATETSRASSGRAGLLRRPALRRAVLALVGMAAAWHALGGFETEAAAPPLDEYARQGLAVQRCLLGAPLAAQERPQERLRRVLWAAEARGEHDWPKRCVGAVRALSQAHKKRHLEADHSLLKLMAAIDTHPRPGDLVNTVAEALSSRPAIAEALGAADGAGAPLAPVPVDLLRLSAMKPLDIVSTQLEASDPVPSTAFTLLYRDGSVCTLNDVASCKLAPDALGGLSLMGLGGGDDGAPVVLWAYANSETTVATLDGAVLYRGPEHPNKGNLHARADGSFLALVVPWGAHQRFSILAGTPEGKTSLTPVDRPSEDIRRGVMLLERDLFWVEGSSAGQAAFTRELLADGARLGPVQALGPVSSSEIQACRTDGLHYVLVGADSLLKRSKAGWSRIAIEGAPGRLACEAGHATVTLFDHEKSDASPRIWRCREQCTVEEVALPPLPGDDRAHAALAPLGEEVLLARAPQRGLEGLRLRLGKAGELSGAPEAVVLDFEGSRPVGLSLRNRDGITTMTFEAAGGIYALRIDAAGRVNPL